MGNPFKKFKNMIQEEECEYSCPECQAPMRERTNRQTGELFFGCSEFPDCLGTRDSDGLSWKDRRGEPDADDERARWSR